MKKAPAPFLFSATLSGLGILGALLVATCESWSANPPVPYPVMLLTGQNNHDWRATTPKLAHALSATGLFRVATVTTPASTDTAESWAKCPLNFSPYHAVVMNWNDFGVKANPDQAVMPWMDALVRYVENGGALVVVHSASLENKTDYPNLAGLGWHDSKFGDRLEISNDGRVFRIPRNEGPGSGHGQLFEWTVTFRAREHPVCTGLPTVWKHDRDELWHGTRGPALNLQVLATAFSPITQTNEPVMWTVRPGKGRVFVTLLGHDAAAMDDPYFCATLSRGCEWAITGRVSQPPPTPPAARDSR
jgi:uncharacterized protein